MVLTKLRGKKMTDLKKFLQENKNEIHDLFNHMWLTIERIALQAENEIPDIDLDNTHGNFINIDDGWSEAYYPNPGIVFPYGEFGFSLDGLFFVLSAYTKKISEEIIVKLLEITNNNDSLKIELYGGDDCFTTLYDSKIQGNLDEIMDSLKKTNEEIIQIDLSIEAFAEEETFTQFIEEAISLYQFLAEKEILAKLAAYEKIE
ncbi:MAG: DUF3201 domain-containing protein [Asgard group archaeon]|nr:DUF3201 domain-containing protein [Asgard group archaeon]